MKSVNHSVCIYLFVLTYFVLTYFVPKMIVKIGKRPGCIHCKKRCDISVFNGTMAHGACLSRSLDLGGFINRPLRAIFLSFFFYILPGARFQALSAGVHCTLRVAGWKPTSNHIEITVGFFNLHRGWLSLHRGHPVNVPIRRTMHLSSVIPANDTRESVFGHRNFSRRERESNLGPLAPEVSA